MISNNISRRYAHALFNIGTSTNKKELDHYGQSLSALGEAVETSTQLRSLLHNPLMSSTEKKGIILALLDIIKGNKIERNFCELLADNNRLSLLPNIANDFHLLLDKVRGIRRGSITTAIDLSNERKKQIQEQMEKQSGFKLELVFAVDPNILGGIVLKVGDIIMDSSIIARLNKLEESIKRGE